MPLDFVANLKLPYKIVTKLLVPYSNSLVTLIIF